MTRRFLWIVLLIGGFLLAGCGGGGQTTHKWFYRFTNAVPDASSGVDLNADKVPVTTGLTYGGSFPTPDYQESDFTNNKNLVFFDMVDSGTTNFLDSIVVEKAADQSVHLFGLGMAIPGSQQPPARLFPVTVVRNTPNGNNVRIVFVHGYIRAVGTQTPHVDLMRSAQTNPIISDVAFGESQTITLAAGHYDFLAVRIAGLMSGTFLTLNNVDFTAGHIYVLLLRGVEGQSGTLAPTLDIFEDPVHDP